MVFGDVDLLREFVAEFRYVGDDAHHATGNLQALDGLGDGRECFGIEGTEALVDEQAVQINGSRGVLDLLAQFQSKRERCKEGLSTA